MRSPVRASLALAVVLLVGPGRGRTVPVGRLVRREGQPDLTEVVDAPVVALAAEVSSEVEPEDTELTEVDYDPEVDGYQSNTLDSLGVTQEQLDKLREAYADRTDIHPYFTRENIYSAKTGFDVYLEDDGDVHINVRIPGLRETIDVDTKLSEEDLNENDQDPNATIDVDKSKVDEVTEPPIVPVTQPSVVVVVDKKEQDTKSGDEFYSDPDQNNDIDNDVNVVVNVNVDREPSESTESEGSEKKEGEDVRTILPSDYSDPDADVPVVEETATEKPEVEAEESSDDDTAVVVVGISPNDYGDPEAENNIKEEETVEEVTDPEVRPVPAPAPEIRTGDKTTGVEEEEIETTTQGNYEEQLKALKASSGLSLFWVFAILFCCFV